ncbi:MAG: B12-binding domain-containing radical SAM protein [Chloroflexi bacterium]|nr:B12-binding domain-containing radical SAM protein [Chloroflexota bacterium]
MRVHMTSVLLIYPYFDSGRRSIFRFPPLGVAYVAAAVRNAGHRVSILDCTFMKRADALRAAQAVRAEVVGIYSMVSMRNDSVMFARTLRGQSGLLVAGGPLPSCEPASFIDDFDVVVVGEGERTIVEVLGAYESRCDLSSIPGIMYREEGSPDTSRLQSGRSRDGKSSIPEGVSESEREVPTHPDSSRDGVGTRSGKVLFNGKRNLEPDLDAIAFPARDLLPNSLYIDYSKRKYGQALTTVMTTRGCPFSCEFCSNAVFGVGHRERSAGNVVDEVEQALALGYDRIHFADDVFTLDTRRVLGICDDIKRRGLDFHWECLGRVDSVNSEVLAAMKAAGCDRIFFGIESGDDSVLKLMRKNITVAAARGAVEAAHAVGLKTGAFFILCYPGETDRTVLTSIKFAVSLPLDYLSFTVPYPLPGTALHERVKSKMKSAWRHGSGLVPEHSLIFDADFSEAKMKFAILKGRAEFAIKGALRGRGLPLAGAFEAATDALFRLMK